MSIFKAAKSTTAYLKAGILGFQGSGKTYTAVEIALGLHRLIKSRKPVAFLDTETGSDWAIPRFRKARVKLQVGKTRAFKDLLAGIQEAERTCEILIIDSISHFWTEMVDAYRRAHHLGTRIPFHHWQPIKAEWRRFSDLFVNSRLHIIACGRAAWEYDMEEDADGHKDLIKVGTRMRVEGEFGYEPSLVLEMERVRETDGRQGKIGAKVIHRCHVLKDRRMDGEMSLDGKAFDNPTFKDFLPHIKALNLGGEQLGVDTSSTSEEIFGPEGESFSSRRRRQQVLLEEIQGELNAGYPGTARQDRLMRLALLKEVFGTYSETRLGEMDPGDLAQGLERIRELVADPLAAQVVLDKQIKRGK